MFDCLLHVVLAQPELRQMLTELGMQNQDVHACRVHCVVGRV